METAVDGIFFSLWTLMFQTDIIFKLHGLLFPPFISQSIFQIRHCLWMIKKSIANNDNFCVSICQKEIH